MTGRQMSATYDSTSPYIVYALPNDNVKMHADDDTNFLSGSTARTSFS